jgi:hypothetical protein
MTRPVPPDTNPLLTSIHQALVDHPEADGFHVSIEPHGREMREPDGSISWIKVLCWNLTRGGEPLSEDDDPGLAILPEDRNEDTLRAEFAPWFSDLKVTIDNEIWIDDEPT